MPRGIQQDVSDGKKHCPRCKERKLLAEFGTTRRAFHGISTYCKACSNELQKLRRTTPEGAQAHRDGSKKWRDKNVDRHKDNNARWRYGVDHGTYDTLLAAQGGKCAICGTAEPGSGSIRFAIDHCHASEVIRGLLCHNCNRGLGYFKDDPARIRRAALYVERSPKRARES